MSAVDTMVQCYHEYKSIWENSSEDDEFICEREVGSPRDTHAVTIKNLLPASVIRTVGHIPSVSSNFMKHGGVVSGTTQCFKNWQNKLAICCDLPN